MTSRERLLTAMRLGTPDMVPVTPDMSHMIPCRLTGKPFWDVYIHEAPARWEAYIGAVRHFGFDGWLDSGDFRFLYPKDVSSSTRIVSQDSERIVQRIRTCTPAGDFEEEVTYYRADPPTHSLKPFTDFESDFEKIKYLVRDPSGYDDSVFRRARAMMGEDGVVCVCLGMPGFQGWLGLLRGGLEALTYAWYDHRELMLKLRDLTHRSSLKQLEMALEVKPDCVLIGASGTLALQSPAMFRELGLGTLKVMTSMCKEAGVVSMLHSCGPERELVKIAAEETELNCINPLEIRPMGDCDLAELKREFGHRICLMGNLHTTEVMLRGTPAEVEAAASKAIDDAGKGGGFILSTGDQCGRDTPEENIFRMIEVARAYGRYA